MYFKLIVLFQTHSCIYWWDHSNWLPLWLHINSTCPILERNNFFSTFKSQEWTKSIFFFYYHNQEMKSWWKCVVLENIHSPPTEGIGNSWVVGGSQRPKNLSKCVDLDWYFQTDGGGGRRKNPFRGGGMDNFWNHTINFMITYCNRKFFNFETNSLYGVQ